MKLSIVIITFNEEANIGRTLESVSALVKANGEIVIVDSGSTDRTVDIAKSHGAKLFVEPWKGYAAQKNSAIEKAGADLAKVVDGWDWNKGNFGHSLPLTTERLSSFGARHDNNLVKQGEYLDLRFHFLRDRFDYEIGFTGCAFDAPSEFQA